MKFRIRVLLDTPLGLIECPWSIVEAEEGSNITIVQKVQLTTDEAPSQLPEAHKKD